MPQTISKKVGRPTKLTDPVVAKLERALEGGFTITKACAVSGISYDAFNERYNRDWEFRQKIDLAKDWATEQARKVVVTAIKNGDLAMSRWWLERKAKDDFNTQPSLNNTPFKLFDDWSDEKVDDFMAKTLTALAEPEPQAG